MPRLYADTANQRWLRPNGTTLAFTGTAGNAAPSAPTNLQASDITNTSFTVTFDPSTDDSTAQGDLVYDREIDGTIASRSTPGDTAWGVTGRAVGTTYTIRVRAVDAAGLEGEWSGPLEVTTTGVPIDALSTYLIATADALARANIVTVANTANYTHDTASTSANPRTYDARNRTIAATPTTESQSYVTKVQHNNGGEETVWVGGLIRTNLSTALHWDEVKGNWDGAGMLHGSASSWSVLDGTRFYNVQDGFRPNRGSFDRWGLRNIWWDYIRDDAIENDGAGSPGGEIHDCLAERVFMFLSCGQNQVWNGVEDMTINRCLVHLAPMPYRYDSAGQDEPYLNAEYGDNADRHGHLFKQHWDSNDYPIHLRDSLLFIEQHSVDGNNSDNLDLLVNVPGSTAENTALFWLGHEPSSYPGNYPAGITEYNLLTHTEAEIRAAWDFWANNWKTRHGFDSGESITDRTTQPAKMTAPDDFAAFDATNLI